MKKLELLFGDPPPAAPTPTGDASQSRWLPRTTNPQGNNLPNSYVNAPISRGTSLPLGQQEWRTWTDHTGTFQVRAALIEVGSHHLVLLKENGRTTTLPISRLSPQDAVYLRRGK
ncbi:MAG: SHD1 domain-containing protein [Pirellulaceae bacterium]